jgi:hypothetical protein
MVIGRGCRWMPRRGAAPQQQHPRIERRDRRQFILTPCAESVREVASSAASLTSVAKQRSGGCCHAAGSWLVRCAACRERSARTTEHMTYPLPQPISKQLRAGRGYEYVQRSCTARTPLAARGARSGATHVRGSSAVGSDLRSSRSQSFIASTSANVSCASTNLPHAGL